MARLVNSETGVVVNVDDDKADRFPTPLWKPEAEPKKAAPKKATPNKAASK